MSENAGLIGARLMAAMAVASAANVRIGGQSAHVIGMTDDGNTYSCNCIGPQNGKPLCPCQMRGVEIVNGRYVKTTDLGPVSPRVKAAEEGWAKLIGELNKRAPAA